MTTRYGVYWAPQPHHPLWSAGCEWLGRDASRPDKTWPPHAATGTPRRYGFHATMKPPQKEKAVRLLSSFNKRACRSGKAQKEFKSQCEESSDLVQKLGGTQ